MNLNKIKILTCSFLAIFCILSAADIQAPKMEIIDTPQGRLTIFPLGITITDKDIIITGKNAVFSERENRARIYDSVYIINPQFKIIADTVVYSFDEKKSLLTGNVVIESDTLRIETQTLTFNQNQNQVSTVDSITVLEKKQLLRVVGKNGYYNFTNENGQINQEPTLYIERQDTTVVTSAQMILDNKNLQFIARNQVTAQTNNSYLNCDSLIFFTAQNYGIALGSPRLIDRENHLSGQVIKFYFSDSTDNNENFLKNIIVSGKASAYYLTNDGGQLEVDAGLFSINYLNKEIENIKVYSDSLNYITGRFIPREQL